MNNKFKAYYQDNNILPFNCESGLNEAIEVAQEQIAEIGKHGLQVIYPEQTNTFFHGLKKFSILNEYGYTLEEKLEAANRIMLNEIQSSFY